jgi:hypothetical protein
VPPADLPNARPGTTTVAGSGSPTEQGLPSAVNIAPTADRADIRPLDVVAALQILLAEVRASLDWSLEGPITQGAGVQTPLQAVHELVDMFLRQLPDDSDDASAVGNPSAAGDPSAWTEAVVQIETAMQSSLERALGVVALWRDVPPLVVDTVKETNTLLFSALGDEPPNPLWLRPEWASLAPRFHRFRRRRRAARRRLTDPDYPAGNPDESEEFLR